MFLGKFFLFLFPLLLLIFVAYISGSPLMVFGFPFLSSLSEGSPTFYFSFCLDSESLIFFFMLIFVSCLVSLYSEFYMTHYNLKKYFFLMFLFFSSMLFLVSSFSFLNFLIGWDGLGVSSLCLIMFYPNKISSYNSLLTFFFNRVGDVLLLIIFATIYSDVIFFTFLFENFSTLLLLFFLFCASTKGAQFPLSSWLPAAMSAPTPISAMVHSSTLVTAGIFILWKLLTFMKLFYVSNIACLLTMGTFLIGGVLANLDLDTKKIVAFSTMSQISMISFFLVSGYHLISSFHMFNHALFKTLIFCSFGYLFLVHLGNQMSMVISGSGFRGSLLNFMFFFSLFMMSGYQFSSSFWAKDLVMESLSDSSSQFFFVSLLLGGLFTLYYCNLLINSSYSSRFILKESYKMFEVHIWKFVGFLCFSSVLICFLLPKILLFSLIPSVGMVTLFFILVIVYSPFFINSPLKESGYWLNYDLFFSKNYLFSIYSFLFRLDTYSYFSSEQMMFKPFLIPMKKGFSFSLFSLGFMILFIFSFFLFI